VGWFFQTRLEARFNFVVAAVLTTLPFAGVHVPLLLLDDQVSVLSVLTGIAGLLILGIVIRLLMGVTLRAASDSVLAVGILHQIFDASNNNGALVDSLLDGADAGNMTQLCRRCTDGVGRRLAAVATSWRIRQRHIPLPDSSAAVRQNRGRLLRRSGPWIDQPLPSGSGWGGSAAAHGCRGRRTAAWSLRCG
jgi:hypothetical protein